MTTIIHVEMRFDRIAEVTITTETAPRWWRRLVLREKAVTTETHRFAVLGNCGHFHWDDTGRLVTDEDVLEVLGVALAAMRSVGREPRTGATGDRSGKSAPN